MLIFRKDTMLTMGKGIKRTVSLAGDLIKADVLTASRVTLTTGAWSKNVANLAMGCTYAI